MNLFRNESRKDMNWKEKWLYDARKCQCVASVQQKEFITASAVYYREQRFAAENAVVVVAGQVSSNLVQCLTSTSLEQYLSSGTVSDIAISGTTMA